MRISATILESFRLFIEQDWMEEGELIASIKGEFIQTPQMLLGTAFGRAIEKADKYRQEDGSYRVPVREGDHWKIYEFKAELIDPALAVFDRRGVFEAKSTKKFSGHDVVAKADQLLGNKIIENKTKLSTVDFDRYAASYQWRFMLDIFEAAAVQYNVFCLSENSRGEIELKTIEQFNLYPYPALRQDCEDLVRRFVEYVQARCLEEFLQEKQYT